MPLHPCLDCGALSSGPRCPGHTRAKNYTTLQAKRERRPYTAEERRRRAQAVSDWITIYGYICPGWHIPAHPSSDLTAEHPYAVALGGDEDQPLTVLCRSCNSRKSNKVDSYTG